MQRSKQLEFFRRQQMAYGGELLKTRKGRSHGRPLDTKGTMHLVLRSTRAVGSWSFRHPENSRRIEAITKKFAARNGVKILSLANVCNHLHIHVKLTTRHTYRSFIRALTGGIAMAVTGAGRGNPAARRFWDYRPFTRVVRGWKNFLILKDYVAINTLEGIGATKREAREILAWKKGFG